MGRDGNQPDLGKERGGDVEGVERSVVDEDADEEMLRKESQEEGRGMDAAEEEGGDEGGLIAEQAEQGAYSRRG